jgi:hypothetical protein
LTAFEPATKLSVVSAVLHRSMPFQSYTALVVELPATPHGTTGTPVGVFNLKGEQRTSPPRAAQEAWNLQLSVYDRAIRTLFRAARGAVAVAVYTLNE